MVDIAKTRSGYQLKALGLGLIPAECIVDKDIMDSETVVDTIKNLRENLKVRCPRRGNSHIRPFRDREKGRAAAHERG
ncbi:MAG: pilus assembly protein PilM [Desulfobacterales bacterium]|nr:pilus assembly protein PilM [Desulfobacterales bacterium]